MLPLWSELRGSLLFLFFGEEQRKHSDWERMWGNSVCQCWVPRSAGLHCRDSVCLPDYLKVSLLHRANRITSFSFGSCSLLYLNSLTNYTVIVLRHSIRLWHWQVFWKHCLGIGVLKAAEQEAWYFHAGKREIEFQRNNSQNPSSLFQGLRHKIRISPNWHSFASLSFPNFSPLHYSGPPPSATRQ